MMLPIREKVLETNQRLLDRWELKTSSWNVGLEANCGIENLSVQDL